MSGFEEETYSTIFTSLKHSVRRKILRMLSEKPRNFSEILEALGISSSHLTYHLENLGELVSKTENGKYNLSKFGEAALETTSRVEETPKVTELKRSPSLSTKWKSFFVVLMVGLVVLSGIIYTQYQFLNKLSAEYEELKELIELVERGASLQSKYTLRYILDKSELNGALYLRGLSPSNCLIYNLNDNSTFDLAFSTSTVLSETHISISVQEGNAFDRTTNETAPVIWSANATANSIYLVPLLSKGWYTISLGGQIRKFFDASGKVSGYTYGLMPTFEDVDCSMSLRIIHEGDYSPFIVKPR